MGFAVIVFPGSNCDHDCFHAICNLLEKPVRYIWHGDTSIEKNEIVIIPGGFSYGDYLRAGAIAKTSPIMKSIKKHANEGRPVIGICNGFQILAESDLLPGTLIRNSSLKFICKNIWIRCESSHSIFTNKMKNKEVLKMPIAHGEGNFFCKKNILEDLEYNQQIIFRYSDSSGSIVKSANPNGSLKNIAGISNKEGNVLGLMPHPERACESILGGKDGLKIFSSALSYSTS
ncbi:MAG: phosphoribosylformylglycinamidine synthase subunit PurQ [Nitrospinota bacterium]|nr:phosphoribosylformylglycinamidine synthase subunit PurQ [Nitrospinota bacterium]